MPAAVPEPLKKRPANLSLAPERLRFAQAYAAAHRKSVSQVVEDLIGALEEASRPFDATVPLEDPLDGMLATWPSMDKKDVRSKQHEARLAR